MGEVERLAAEVREQNQLYERGEVDRAFYLGQRHRLDAIKRADESLSNTRIGKLVGKSEGWVQTIRSWDHQRADLPDWKSGSNRREDIADRAIRERPEMVAKALENPEYAHAVARAASPKAHGAMYEGIRQEEVERHLDRSPSRGTTRAEADAESKRLRSEREPEPVAPDPWAYWDAAMMNGRGLVRWLDQVFAEMHPDAWDDAPVNVGRDAEELAPKLRDKAAFLEGLAHGARQHAK